MAKKRKISERVTRFAREYVQLVEALIAQGVPEEIARNEARVAATTWLMEYEEEGAGEYDPAKGPCPTCGRG